MDLYNNLLPQRALSPVAARTDNTAIVSEIIDTQGFERVMFYILVGVNTDADAVFTVLIEEGDDSGLSDNAAVADSQLNPTEAIVSFDFADDNQVRRIEVRPTKRYVRMTITPANNDSGNIFVAAMALLGNPRHAPVTAQAA